MSNCSSSGLQTDTYFCDGFQIHSIPRKFLHSFYYEFFNTGLMKDCSLSFWREQVEILFKSWGPTALFVSVCLALASTRLIWRHHKSKLAMSLAELSAIIQTALPVLMPWKVVRFFLGLYVFVSFMSIHSRICEGLQKKEEKLVDDESEREIRAKLKELATDSGDENERDTESESSSDNDPDINNDSSNRNKNNGNNESNIRDSPDEKLQLPNDAASDSLKTVTGSNKGCDRDSFRIQLLRTYFYNLYPRLEFTPRKIPTLNRISYSLFVLFLIDACMWTMREFIPHHISEPNRYMLTALVAGAWVLFSMEHNYNNGIMFLELDGAPLPFNMRHRHPLLSTSLAEFWGTRWNPVIGKMLQDAFYKPLRRLGFARHACVLGCFLGSAILHAFPQYISTWSLTDGLMMGGFFLLQGLLVLFEFAILSVLNLERYSAKYAPRPAGAHTKAKFQWTAEIFTITFVLLCCYFAWEREKVSSFEVFLIAVLALITCCSVLLVHAQAEGFASVSRPKRAFLILCGWLWTVTCVIGTMPLFSVPVFHAVEDCYTRSVVVGPALRAIEQTLFQNSFN